MIEKYSEKRPWGSFMQYCRNMPCTVKIINVNPNSKLSLQYHNNRDEFWKVLSGEAFFVVGDERKFGKKGDEFIIPRKALHRVEAADSKVEFLEVSFGDFDEDDIVRVEDSYGRVKRA